MGQNTSSAVMQQRHEAPVSLDYFPTPPWATRALCEHLEKWGGISKESVWEPACGNGYMARPLAEYFQTVWASDVHRYPFVAECGFEHDFLWPGPPPNFPVDKAGIDWIVTNPPFRLAEQFALKALAEAEVGVALLVRSAFLEGIGRLDRLFGPNPPEWCLQFSERVPMVKDRLDEEARSATAYCWLIWLTGRRIPPPGQEYDPTHFTALTWIPACRKRLEKPGDYGPTTAAEQRIEDIREAAQRPGPLFAETAP